MNSSQRIVLNTTATYARSLFGLSLSLFSSRWVFNSLGQIDFGIFSVVGSLIVFITLLNNVMASSVGRHFAFAIGQRNSEEVNRWFNAAISIHFFLAVGLTLVGWQIGDFIIAHKLTIPVDRLSASHWVFQVSLVSAFTSMVSVPFVAMFVAKQHIAELSVWGMLQSILTFTLAFMLTIVSGERLLIYATGMVVILIFIQTAKVFRALYVFRECGIKYHLWFDKRRVKQIFSFTTWNLIGSLGGTLRDQGSVLLLNLFFGPKVNAAFGIASQVSTQTNQLSTAMLSAFSPEVTASEGRGDRERMISLSLRSCKFGATLVILFAVPIMVEMEYVLELWLIEPPIHSALFCRMILCTILIDRMSAGYMLAVQAYGRIAAYQATLGTCLVLTLPLAWLFLKLGFAPTSIGVAFIITMIACSLGRVFWVWHLLGVPPSRWLTAVVMPCTLLTFASAIAAMAPFLLYSPSFLRLVIVSTAAGAAWLMTTWFVALDSKEIIFIEQNTINLLSGLRNKFKNAVYWIVMLRKE